jgi:hypothetical protein
MRTLKSELRVVTAVSAGSYAGRFPSVLAGVVLSGLRAGAVGVVVVQPALELRSAAGLFGPDGVGVQRSE